MTIGVVILNYNSWQATEALVVALQQQTVSGNLAIIVVDNASPNGSYGHLSSLPLRYSNVVAVLQAEKNFGYARGNNVGLQWLDEHIHPDYAVVANNDIVLSEDCLEKLAGRISTLKDACVISPVQVLPDGRRIGACNLGSWSCDLKNLSMLYRLLHKSGRKEMMAGISTGQELIGAVPSEMIPGSFMFVDFQRFKRCGFFYPGTFLFVEERFVAHAVKQAGFRNYILTDMTYLHEHSKTINTAFSQVKKYRLQYDGWLKFTRICRPHGRMKAILMWPLIQLSLTEIAVVYALKGGRKR